MMKVKWTLQWLFVSIILGLDYLQRISANEAVTYIPALECYDRYGKPQVNIHFRFARTLFAMHTAFASRQFFFFFVERLENCAY